MSGLRIARFIALALAPLALAQAAPMSPSARDVAGSFSPAVQDAFTLLADTDNANLVYYVPRRGGVAVQSPLSASPVPRFQIFGLTPSYGVWAGMEMASLGGTLSTTADLGALGLLQAEAAAKGYTITPAPARTATTVFMATGYELPAGGLQLTCTTETLEITNPTTGVTRTINIPHCTIPGDPENTYDVDTNVMYKWASLPALSKSVVAQNVTFQATTLPSWTPQLRALMGAGGQWDNVLTGRIQWDIQTGNLTRQARFHINWQALFERASAYVGVHYGWWVDSDVRAFFQQLVQCSAENECGVRVEYLQPNGTWGPVAPNDANFVNVAQAMQRSIELDLFNRVRVLTSPVFAPVSSRSYAVFTIRANYEKLMMSTNEVRYISWNPGPEDFGASTELNVSCLMGGFELGKVTWNMDDPGCKAMLGQ